MSSPQVTDINVASTEPLPAPDELLRAIPRTETQENFVAQSRREIQNIIFGSDKRLLLVVGPCSIHDTKAGAEYARKLAKVAAEVKDRIYVVMRVYYEKPRTTVGWKGLAYDPDLDGKGDMAVSNAIGSNVFDILLGLGLPWFLNGLIYNVELGVDAENLLPLSLILVGTLIGVYLSALCCGFYLTKPLGLFFFALYFVFVAYNLAHEFGYISF